MTVSKECLLHFAKIIEQEIGVIYAEVNHYQLAGRLAEVAGLLGDADAEALWQRSVAGKLSAHERLRILDIATNNETYFFRDVNVFRAIGTYLAAARPTGVDNPFRIWSAACSSGQEAVSLAMMCLDVGLKRPFEFRIVGTDVSERVLSRASSGRYTQLEVQRGLDAGQLARFFHLVADGDGEGGRWAVKDEIKSRIAFHHLNLLQPWPASEAYDLILCRNVLIYQTVENRRRVVARLEERLVPGGILVMGGAESLVGINDALQWTDLGGVVVYQKRGGAAIQAS